VNVLVCDDDRATRFVVSRILTQHFGVVVTECSNGLDALKTLSTGQFHFMLLDVEMPGMSGIEVLEMMRASARTKNLPVVVLSHVRDGDAISYLLKLGVSDYLLKPPRADKLVEKIHRLLRVLPRTQQVDTDGSSLRVSPASPALVVDGDASFREALAKELGRYGLVRQADSGAAAVRLFREKPVGIVFVGGDLGVIGPELLARKLREYQPDGPLRVVAVAEQAGGATPGLFDATIKRSRLPRMLRASLQPFVRADETLSGVMALVPNLPEIAATATSQMLGMMFDGEVTATMPSPVADAVAETAVGIEIADKFVLTIGVSVDEAATPSLSAKLSSAAESPNTAPRQPAAAELAVLIAGRVHAILRERGVESVDGPARPFAASNGSEPPDSDDTTSRLQIPEVGDVVLTFSLHDRADAPAEPELAVDGATTGA
jgi:DNA-binding response OmpR family regulator